MFSDDNRRTEELREIIYTLSPSLMELNLSDNSMKNEDLDIISSALAGLPNLRHLVLSKNVINGEPVRRFLDTYL